jgi:hypothetical protein
MYRDGFFPLGFQGGEKGESCFTGCFACEIWVIKVG